MTYNVTELLAAIDPALLSYQSWVNVGMALKEGGYTAAEWDDWCRRDAARYHVGECFRKWKSFNGTGAPVTLGTVVQYAKEQGWAPPANGYELDWDSQIGAHDREGVVVDKNWLEAQELPDAPYPCGVSLLVKWCFPVTGRHRDGEYRTTRPDTGNLQKLLKDVMTGYGFWTDNALVCREVVENVWAATPGIFNCVEAIR